ncbi:23S rRNA (pseudouridine(1915)-N(3))-methyltransferase RlmH [Salinisphaera aquimarina]|uniref:Ribosomal RNA large subunit methyltransferase H n=1 Tax=Salinisphaera aquimarina TaxID=2094031 RepID=A0ABV7EMU9_9GAMM
MVIRLLAVGRRMPAWVTTAFGDYARRLPRECRLELVEIAPGARSANKNNDIARAVADEDKRMCAAIGADMHAIALTVDGKSWSTEQLAESMREWLADGRDRALLVGGPDGLGANSLARASQRWSLSALTLPHPLVRVVLAEQLYRAHSILTGHPYHRG